MQDRSTYLYFLRSNRGSGEEKMSQEELYAMIAHSEYAAKLSHEGIVIFAGAAKDATLGVVVFLAKDEAAAETVFENDPAILSGMVSGVLMPFNIGIMAGMD